MKLFPLFSIGLLGLIFTTSGAAIATPEIASGDRRLGTDLEGCLLRVDTYIDTLDIQILRGEIDRTGYFNDGAFRILCYPDPYAEDETSLAVIFAAHDSDPEVAATFVQVALNNLAEQP
ncbi:MAG: hypothetical protein F6J97_00670 [Leptolyngbya sp. SIO4C1]|nr:hypothetical protein [Leptolyngbya sp. SIO4C1]